MSFCFGKSRRVGTKPSAQAIALALLKNAANPGKVVPRRASSANIPSSFVGRMPLPDLQAFSNSLPHRLLACAGLRAR